jgi:hypothetical protein
MEKTTERDTTIAMQKLNHKEPRMYFKPRSEEEGQQ